MGGDIVEVLVLRWRATIPTIDRGCFSATSHWHVHVTPSLLDAFSPNFNILF
jgi:hypothetical protein